MPERPAKIRIIPYTDNELRDQDSSVEEYIVPVNPEQYSLSYKVKYDAEPSQGGQGVEERFISSMPEELKLEFIVDATNTIYGYKYSSDNIRSVPDQIQHLKSVVYNMSGEIHQPRLLKIVGLGIAQRGNGDVTYDGILTDLQITYTLFDPDGTPLRAKISATFLDYRENRRRVLEENRESPDLTHVRNVKESDTLPLLSYKMYDDPSYYLELAKANNLTNFRSLYAGQELIFPSIDKTVK